MKKVKLAFLAIVTALVAACCSGCFDYRMNHNAKHLKAWWQNTKDFHEEVDYFFFDYSPTDPYRN